MADTQPDRQTVSLVRWPAVWTSLRWV